MKKIVSLKKITIRNFKGLKEISLPLKKMNEFYGKNQTGKTSVLDAVRFVFSGKKNDQTKVRVGEDKAEVEMELTENGVPILVKTKIEKDGSPSWTMKMKGVKKSNPREILKRMFSFGTFNPREMVTGKDRLARLLQLIPLKLDHKDLLMSNNKPFPIQDREGLDFDLHAYQVLKDVEKDLRAQRHSLFQKKDILSKALDKKVNDYENTVLRFKEKHDNQDPIEYEGTHVRHALNLSEHNQKIDRLVEKSNQKESELMAKKQAVFQYDNDIESRRESFQKTSNDLKRAKDFIVKAEKELIEKKDLLRQAEKRKKNLAEEMSQIESEISSCKENYERLNKQTNDFSASLLVAKDAQVIKDKKKEIQNDRAESDLAVSEWKEADRIVKSEFNIFMEKTLKPIQEKVPGLSIKDGEFRLNGVSLDELSGSEVIKLGIELMRLENNGSNLILINEAEALDLETLREMDFENEQVLIARVGESPINNGDKWNSIEMGDKNKS